VTTLAYKNGELAADSLVWEDNTAVGTIEKIGRFPDGSMWGFCGKVAHLHILRSWMSWPFFDEPPEIRDSALIIVTRTGEVRVWEEDGWVEFNAPFYSWGHGHQICLGAMAMGATARQALEIAADMDSCTGGAIMVLTLAADAPEDDDLDIPDMPLEEPMSPVSLRQKMRQGLGLE
jgi:ATP-dependent HslUV protease subunit HslV